MTYFLVTLATMLLFTVVVRAKGHDGYSFYGKAAYGFLMAIPFLPFGLTFFSIVAVASFAGMNVTHGDWLELKSENDRLPLAITGLTAVIAAVVGFSLSGSPVLALALAVFGLLKVVAYMISIDKYGPTRHIKMAECIQGALIGIPMGYAYYALL